jgi:hypothetical protein
MNNYHNLRVVVSLTTLPDRLQYINRTIKSVLNQTTQPDRVYLNVPYKTLKGKAYDSNVLRIISEEYADKLTINRCVDMGPITKLIPTLELELSDKTIIITVDDDIEYSPTFVEGLLKNHSMYPGRCLAYSGWCKGSFPFYFQYAGSNTDAVEVDWVQGVTGVLYERGFFDVRELLQYHSSLPTYIRRNDDHVISSYLHNEGVQLLSIGIKARDIYKHLPHRTMDSISGRSTFLAEVVSIVRHFKNIYTIEYSALASPVFWAMAGITGVSVGVCVKKIYMVVPIVLVVMYVAYTHYLKL